MTTPVTSTIHQAARLGAADDTEVVVVVCRKGEAVHHAYGTERLRPLFATEDGANLIASLLDGEAPLK